MIEYLKGMFANLGWSFPKEPVLWMAFIAAVLNVAVSIIQGDLVWTDGLESIVALFLGFVARGASTPLADPKLTDGTKLTPQGS